MSRERPLTAEVLLPPSHSQILCLRNKLSGGQAALVDVDLSCVSLAKRALCFPELPSLKVLGECGPHSGAGGVVLTAALLQCAVTCHLSWLTLWRAALALKAPSPTPTLLSVSAGPDGLGTCWRMWGLGFQLLFRVLSFERKWMLQKI